MSRGCQLFEISSSEGVARGAHALESIKTNYFIMLIARMKGFQRISQLSSSNPSNMQSTDSLLATLASKNIFGKLFSTRFLSPGDSFAPKRESARAPKFDIPLGTIRASFGVN